MTFEKSKKLFKQHYKKAMKLKEGGAAWEREITLAKRYKDICISLKNVETSKKYGY